MIFFSGISTGSKSFTLFSIRHKVTAKIFRLKPSPISIHENEFESKEFSEIISGISIGPAFKTTGVERHNGCDDLIYDYAEKMNREEILVGDIGVSDGSASLYLLEKFKGIKNAKLRLFDKYNFLQWQNSWFGDVFSNCDGKMVYVKILFLLIYVYPLNLPAGKKDGKKICFDNPHLKRVRLNIDYFDILTSHFSEKFDIIKCANVLNMVYFSQEDTLKALGNLFDGLRLNGFLFLIHNKIPSGEEFFLILKKQENGFEIVRNNYKEFVEYIKNTSDFIRIKSDTYEKNH